MKPALAALFIMACLLHLPPAAATPDTSRRITLHEFDGPALGDLSLELSIAPCEGNGCPIELSLHDATGLRDTQRLDWLAVSRDHRAQEADAASGAYLPLSTERPKAWSVGLDEVSLEVSAELIDSGTSRPLLLAHQLVGFDHLKRRHYLYSLKGGRLSPIETFTVGSGPHWSAVATHRGRLYHYQSFSPYGTPSDTLHITRLDITREGKLARAPAETLFAVVHATHHDADHLMALQAGSDCLREFLRLPGEQIGLTAGTLSLAAIAVDKKVAEAGAERLRACLPGAAPTVRPVDPGRFYAN